jgi:hypothetical protein
MERKNSNDEDYKRIIAQQEEDSELEYEIDQLAFDFEKKYFEVVEGNQKSADLYSGDFVPRVEPEKLIIHTSKGRVLSKDYVDVFDRFVDIIGDDMLDEDPQIDTFSREPEPRTEYLKNFLKFNEGKELLVLQTTRKLKTNQENTVLLLTLDRYFKIESSQTPFSETWTIRKLKFDITGDDEGGFGKRSKAMPRSMVRTLSLPGVSGR